MRRISSLLLSLATGAFIALTSTAQELTTTMSPSEPQSLPAPNVQPSFAAPTQGTPNSVTPVAKVQPNGDVLISWTPDNKYWDVDSGAYIKGPARDFTYMLRRGSDRALSPCDTLLMNSRQTSYVDTGYAYSFTPPGSFVYKLGVWHNGIVDVFNTEDKAVVRNACTALFYGGHYTTPLNLHFWPSDSKQADDQMFYTTCKYSGWKRNWCPYGSPYNGKKFTCPSNTGTAASVTYLIMAPIKVEKDHKYTVTIHAVSDGTCPFSVKGGWSNANKDQNDVLLSSASFDQANKWTEFEVPFTAAQDGYYFISIQLDPLTKDNGAFWLAGVDCTEGCKVTAPGSVTNVTVPYNQESLNQCVITFTTPTTNVAGETLESLLGVNIYRDNTKLYTCNTQEKGVRLTYTDNVVPEGRHSYVLRAFNEQGEGPKFEFENYSGINIAQAPAQIQAEAISDTEVRITWTSVTKDVDGHALKPEWVKYNVYRQSNYDTYSQEPLFSQEGKLLVSNTTDTSVVVNVTTPGKQLMARYIVKAVTEGRESSMARTMDYVVVGKALSMPWTESFTNGYWDTNFGWAMDANPDAYWGLQTFNIKTSCVDKDYGSVRLYLANGDKDYIGIISPLVHIPSLEECPNPCAGLYDYPVSATSKNAMRIEVNDGTGWHEMVTAEESLLGASNKWAPFGVFLREYAGKDVQVRFTASQGTYSDTKLDNFQIYNKCKKNLGIQSVVCDLEKVYAGQVCAISVKVRNYGDNAITQQNAGTVQLKREGKMIGEVALDGLDPIMTQTARFYDTIPNGLTEANYEAVLTLADDWDGDNLRQNVFEVVPMSERPTVTNLSGELVGQEVILHWDAPSTENVAGDPVVEDFESYDASQYDNIGDWKIVDADNLPLYDNKNIGSWNKDKKLGWWIFDEAIAGSDNATYDTYASLDGNKCLAAQKTSSGEADDWLISPRLSGQEQEISLLASDSENLGLYISSTGDAVDDFSYYAPIPYAPLYCTMTRAWTTLPQGTRHFAIRHHKDGSMGSTITRLDNVSYTPALQGRALKGYNIYCDGNIINDEPVCVTEYRNAAVEGSHNYCVKAVYDKGESKASNSVSIEFSSISDIHDDQNRIVKARYNAAGQEVGNEYKGVVIVKYKDGTARKTITR